MDSTIAPEISSLEAFLAELSSATSANVPTLQIIARAYNATHPSVDDPIKDLMRVLFALPTMAVEMPRGAVQKTAQKCLESLSNAFSTDALTGDWATFKRNYQRDIDISLATITIFHDVKFDAVAFSTKKADVAESIEKLEEAFHTSGMSHQSLSIVSAQIQLLKNSLTRFETTGVGPFRDSYFSILGRVVIEIHKDEKIDDQKRAELVKSFLAVAGVISTIGDIASLTGPVISGFLTGPK